MTATTCPCCGSAVRVHTGDEGTSSYEPAVSAATIETVRAALVLALFHVPHSDTLLRERERTVIAITEALAALPPKPDGPTSEPRIRTIGDLTRAMTEAGLEPPDECA